MLARLVLFVAAYFLTVRCNELMELLDEMSKPTLFPEKQAAKRSIALKIAEQGLNKGALLDPTTTSWGDITSVDAPPSEYYMIRIDLSGNPLPLSVSEIPKVKKVTKIGTAFIILVKTDESRDQVLYELRSSGYFNYQVQKSYQHSFNTVQNSLDRLDQRELPLDNSYTSIGNGSGVHAYVIDTGGLSSHAEFEGNYNLDFVVDGEPTTPCGDHGTAVASVLLGKTLGVAPGAIYHDIKVGVASIGCATYTSHIIDSLAWIAENGTLPGVINLSLQGPGNSVLDAVIGQLYALGFFVVTAAGNAASPTAACTNSPARAPFALSVGAIDDTDTIAYFSNYGDCVDIWALGYNVPVAVAASNTSYGISSGTSISSPVVAGLSAVYYSLFHYTESSQIKTELTNSAVYRVIQGMPADVSNNRLASTYKYQLGATITSAPGSASILSVF